MTISTTSTKISYQANGSTIAWSFSFPGGPDPDIHVFVTGPTGTAEILTNLKININPPIDPNPTSVGGTVIYPVSGAPLALGNKITIVREVPNIQPTSFANQAIIYQEVLEKAIDYVVMEVQQLQEEIDRAIVIPITEDGPLVLPGCPERANKFLAFDENCKPVAVGNSNPITSTNGVRVPNTETIPELPARPARPGGFISFNSNGDPVLVGLPPPNLQPLLGQRVTITSVHTAVNAEKGFLFQLSGNTFYDFILGDPATYDADFSVAIFNGDVYTGPGSGRAKRIMFNGVMAPGGFLWPGQWIYVFRYGSTWVANPRDTRWKPGAQVTFFVDPVNGPTDTGTSDGLGTGTGATKTVATAVSAAIARVDYGGILASSGAIIQLAQGTYTENILVNLPTVGGLPITIKGADDGIGPGPWIFRVPANGIGIRVDLATSIFVKGLTFVSAGADAVGVEISRGANMIINNCTFGTFTGSLGYHIQCFDNGVINTRDINVTGNVSSFLVLRRSSTARMSGKLTVTPGLAFSYFMVAQGMCNIIGGAYAYGDSTDFSLVGSAGCTGTQYVVQNNSFAALGPGYMDAMPGNVAGIVGGSAPLHGTDASMVF